MLDHRFAFATALGLLFCLAPRPAYALDPYVNGDPYWILLHEPALVGELSLSANQRESYRKLLDELDLKYFPLRNKKREEALAGVEKIKAEAADGLKRILDPAQERRINEVLLQQLGYAALLRDDVAPKLRYTDSQRKRLKDIMDETQAAAAKIQKEIQEGKPRGPLDKKHADLELDQSKKLLAVLKPDQQASLKKLLGKSFDMKSLGLPVFKAPELVDTDEWINATSPQRLESLRGKVVVVHFYAFGCINCIRNFPWYREWFERFHNQDVALIGIHTPETPNERQSANVRRKALDEKFDFPVLIDGKNENWNAWGNSMWPSVYVIDKRGYLRYFWPGELKWQGNDGEKYMRERIEMLLKEPA